MLELGNDQPVSFFKPVEDTFNLALSPRNLAAHFLFDEFDSPKPSLVGENINGKFVLGGVLGVGADPEIADGFHENSPLPAGGVKFDLASSCDARSH